MFRVWHGTGPSFRQIHSETQEQKAKEKYFEGLNLRLKGTTIKLGLKVVCLLK